MDKYHLFRLPFYFDRWAGADGKICATRNVFGTLAQFRIDPSAALLECHFYRERRHSVAAENAAIRRRFIEPLKTVGDRIVSRCIAGVPMYETDALLWAMFLVSIRKRTPFSRVGSQKHEKNEETNLQIGPIRALATGRPAAEPFCDSPTTKAAELWHKVARADGKRLRDLNGLTDLPIDDKAVRQLLTRDWYLLNLEKTPHVLLTSDRPCVYTRAIDDPECVVFLPITPKLAFCALSSGSHAAQDLMDIDDGLVLATALNISVSNQAVRFIYSRGEADAPAEFLRLNVPFDLSE